MVQSAAERSPLVVGACSHSQWDEIPTVPLFLEHGEGFDDFVVSLSSDSAFSPNLVIRHFCVAVKSKICQNIHNFLKVA